MELFDVMRTTFAAREFTGEAIPDSTLYDIIENARFAPSGGNRQGNRVIVIREPGTKDALAQLAEPAAKRYTAQVKAGENPWNSVIPTKLSEQTIAATRAAGILIDSFRNASIVLVFTVDMEVVAAMDQNLDRIGIVGGASIYPFVWNVLLGLRQAGFGGTITTLAVAREPAVQSLLGIPEKHAVAAIVPVGKPVKQLKRLSRRAVEEIAVLEHFEGKPLGN